MGGRKLHLIILLIVLLSIGMSEGAPRLGRRNRKRVGLLGVIVGSASRAMVQAYSKPKTSKAPAIAIFMPAVAAYPNQQYYQPPLGAAQGIQPAQTYPVSAGTAGQFNHTGLPALGQFNQTHFEAPTYAPNVIGSPVSAPNGVGAPAFTQNGIGAPAYVPNSIDTAAPGTPVQYPVPPNGVQSIDPVVGISKSSQIPDKNSASTFHFNSGCFGLIAIVSYLMITGNRFYL